MSHGDDLADLLRARAWERALAWLHKHHDAEIAALLRSEQIPSHDRADLSQTIWLAVQQSLPRYRGDSTPATWLGSIARHKIADWRRSRRRLLETLTTDMVKASPLLELLGLRAPRTPSSEARGRQRRQQLAIAFSELSAEELELVELRFAEGLVPQQIAEQLASQGRLRPDGGSYRAADVSQRLHRALQKLRKRLGEEAALG